MIPLHKKKIPHCILHQIALITNLITPTLEFPPCVCQEPSMMQIPFWTSVVSIFLLLNTAKSQEELFRDVLVEFMSKLSNNSGFSDPNMGWTSSSLPCKDKWRGITCDQTKVKSIVLDGFGFSGFLDARVLCNVQSLAESLQTLNLMDNGIHGENLEEIENCSQLTQLLIGGNNFLGSLPTSISQLKNLKSLDISRNKFSGPLPDLPEISDLEVFQAQNNQFIGAIPNFDYSELSLFNVSNNNFSGEIPDRGIHFDINSYLNNPQLCGAPLSNKCWSPLASQSEPSAPPDKPKNGNSNDQILMYSGYILIGLAVLFLILLWLYKRSKRNDEKLEADNRVAAVDDSMIKPSFSTVELKAGGISKTGISTISADQSMVSSSLIVLTSPEVNGLRFEDLLKAPAELLGRGNHGSVYKVSCEAQGTTLAVKRIKDWTISSHDFKQRMRRLDQVKHPNVLPAVAFYSSTQEKLLVYEYQPNGSLFRLIHGNQTDQAFDWESRIFVASTIADTLVFMHDKLHYDGIAHGNLKSSNILLNTNMDPLISEYGLMVVDNQDRSIISSVNSFQASKENFKEDVYAFGVILLEMLTGKMPLNNGLDLASWVLAVVCEEWTVEVFDKILIGQGASEERMVNLLQVAIKCVNKSREARPSMNQVALMIRAIKEDDDRSADVSGLSIMTR
ncbi:probable inactive receptor kinase At2g26730 [Olea europaea subsp. europaea]|uniref:Probable inactive receptor kinase At2g26730 n=1 Tax=Olea europaea subsp. europaea TaxID=158383 RepID=A0A8S0TYW2_OLEEU|nr:probable inactive receptor kinase At2g26730 [Olea europaea subsp. europaea]